jgi:hypothetical protein
MKSKGNLVSTGLLIAALFAVSFASAYAVAQSQDAPTKDEVTALLKTAKTPLEHHRISMYYQQEALRLKQDAEFHRAYANIYGKGQGLAHCTNLAKLDDAAAKEANALALIHENLAKDVEQKH